MKATCFFKLTRLTGFAALGLLAAEVAHVRAPSGPIAAAPSQAAPGAAANGSNPAPLPAPRTSILGAWKFNPDESDDPSKRRQGSRGSNGGYGGGHGRMGGGYPGGGHGGYGRGPPGGGKKEEHAKKKRALPPPESNIRSPTLPRAGLQQDRGRTP